ncbi:SGNH/GDSL hydrolase family protein [soil metagenome]
MIKRTIAALGVGVVAVGVMLGVEIYAALNRDYLPTEPAMEIGGTFGADDAPPLRFVVLGDSTAAGVGAGDVAHAYPTVLAERLAARGRRVTLSALGVSGARVADVLHEQVGHAVAAHPQLVFVGIGANDTLHATRLDSVRADMAAIIDRLQAAGASLVVAGAPDMRAAAFAEPLRSIAGWRGRQVAAAIGATARAKGVPVVPLAQETGHLFAAAPERYNSEDDFHPSGAGYALWADAIYPYLEHAVSPNEAEGNR